MTYFTSGPLTINFSSTGLYLVGYHVLNATVATLATASWDTIGNTWFGLNETDINTAVRPTTTTTTLSPTGASNTTFPASMATTELTATGAPGNTLTDAVGVLTEYTGDLYAMIKVMTKNTAKFFSTLDSSVPSASLLINGSPATASTFYTNTLTTQFRASASGAGNFSGGFANYTAANAMGAFDVAQILFKFSANTAQDQVLLDTTDSIALTLSI